MSEAYRSGSAGGAIRSESGQAPALRTAEWLCLAAAPTFLIMALVTSVLGGGQPDILCSAVAHTSPPSGMVVMYLVMSAFHSPPWLKLISSRDGNGVCTAGISHGGRYVAAPHGATVRAMVFDRQHAVGEVQERIGTGETHGQD